MFVVLLQEPIATGFKTTMVLGPFPSQELAKFYCSHRNRENKVTGARYLGMEVEATFCTFCGASIPHRTGEGRCNYCMDYIPKEERTL